MKHVTIIRHGETADNYGGVIQGWIDTGLNEQGREQVRSAAHTITVKPGIIFTSDLGRAQQSADVIYKELGYNDIPVLSDWRLRERYFGTAQGKSKKDIDLNSFYTSDPDSRPYDAESENQFSDRVWSFIQSLSLIQHDTILITSHSGVLNRFGYLLDPDFEFVKYDNAAIVSYAFDPETVINQLRKEVVA